MGVKSPAHAAYRVRFMDMSNNPLSSDAPQAQLIPHADSMAAAPPFAEIPEVAAQRGTEEPSSLPSSDPKMDEAAKQEFLWHTHQYLSEYARFGDTKAGFAGAIAVALLGALFSVKAHIAMLQQSFGQWTLPTWLAAMGETFLCGSVALAVWTVLPRLGSSQSKGFVYWNSIAAHGSVDLLQTSFHSQSAHTLNDHLLHHVFDISSKVCIPKYRSVSLCILALSIGGVLAAAALVLQDLPGKAFSPSLPATAPVSAPHK